MSNQPIGLFDSGVGGLSVLRELKRQLPQENVIYFADTLHMPYGPRSAKELNNLVFAILEFLQAKHAKLVIMACNTSSAIVLPKASKNFRLPLIGMIEPVAKTLAQARAKGIGLLATEATVASGKYEQTLREQGYQGVVVSQPCPKLASLIEAGESGQELVEAIAEYVQPLQATDLEQVVLGCTHYPFAAEQIQSAFKSKVELVNPAVAVVKEAASLLKERGQLNQSAGKPVCHFYVSGDPQQFDRRALNLLGTEVNSTKVAFLSADGRLVVTS